MNEEVNVYTETQIKTLVQKEMKRNYLGVYSDLLDNVKSSIYKEQIEKIKVEFQEEKIREIKSEMEALMNKKILDYDDYSYQPVKETKIDKKLKKELKKQAEEIFKLMELKHKQQITEINSLFTENLSKFNKGVQDKIESYVNSQLREEELHKLVKELAMTKIKEGLKDIIKIQTERLTDHLKKEFMREARVGKEILYSLNKDIKHIMMRSPFDQKAQEEIIERFMTNLTKGNKTLQIEEKL